MISTNLQPNWLYTGGDRLDLGENYDTVGYPNHSGGGSMPTGYKTISAAVIAAWGAVLLARRCDDTGVGRAILTRQRMAVAQEKQRARRRGGHQ